MSLEVFSFYKRDTIYIDIVRQNRVQVCNTSHHEIFENQKSFLENCNVGDFLKNGDFGDLA